MYIENYMCSQFGSATGAYFYFHPKRYFQMFTILPVKSYFICPIMFIYLMKSLFYQFDLSIVSSKEVLIFTLPLGHLKCSFCDKR